MTASILITGGAGYIGSHIVLALLAAGKQPIVLDNLSTGARELVPAGVPFVHGNCGDRGKVSDAIRAYGVDSVIHCAGSIRVDESVRDPLLYYGNNTSESRSLIETCVREGITSFLFSSTAAVYGDPAEIPVREDALLRPVNPYGRSKLMTETMLADASAYGLNYASLRYFNVAGADPEGHSGQITPFVTHLIRRAIHAALGLVETMQIFGTDWPTPDGTCIRDYIHVSDLAEAHVLALDYLHHGGASRAMNCGYGMGFSVREVLHTVEAVANCRLTVVETGRRPGDPAALVADASWLRHELGWKPRHADLSAIVSHALGWERRQVNRNLSKAR
jgi:UDP-glucose 4-epimerase